MKKKKNNNNVFIYCSYTQILERKFYGLRAVFLNGKTNTHTQKINRKAIYTTI